jgi:hypothetical protein
MTEKDFATRMAQTLLDMSQAEVIRHDEFDTSEDYIDGYKAALSDMLVWLMEEFQLDRSEIFKGDV